MQFDSYEHLASHQKRFCNDGEFGTIQKLENKYQEYTNPRHEQMPAGSSNPKTGSSPDRNADFQRLYNSEMQTRTNQMENDINRIKQEKAALRLKKQEEEQALADLMQASEQNKEKNLRTRFEKEQILKDIRDLDKNKINYLEVEKKNQLEHIAAERELLRQKEQQLSGDLVRLENEAKAMARIREEDIRRQDDALDKLRKRGDENTKVQDILLHEKSDRVAELRMRRENLEFEKQRLMEDQEKIRNGDFAGARRPNYGLYSANQMLGTIGAIKNYDIGNARQAITNDQQKIAHMKNDQQNIVRNEHIYPDFLHASPPSNKYDNNPYGKPYGSPNTLLNNTNYATPDRVNGSSSLLKRSPTTGSPFTNNANNILSPSGSLPSHHLLNSHSPYQGPAVLPEHVQAQSLGEVLQLQNRYINGGGQDPNVLKNFESLENFYRGVASQAHTRPIDNVNANQGNPQLQQMIDQKEQDNLKLKHELEMLKMQNAKLPSAIQSGSFTIADMNLKLNGMDAQKKNIFSIYTGGTEFFIQNEARNVDLNEHERMAVNLSAQEADALRMLSQLPIGTELYRFKLEQYKELSQLRSETEKILQEQRLLEMRRNFEKVRRDEDRKYENERWVDEQRKNIIGNRLRKDLNPPKVAKGYDPTEGFIIHWDYLLSVPKRNDSCQVVYGIYINGNEVYPPSMVEPHPCEVDTSVTNRCIFGKSHPVAEIPANANALLIFEVQLFPSKDSTNPRLTSFGWSQLDLFDARRELKRGKFKVPLYECPTDTNQDIDGIRDLTPVQNGVSWLYLRISYPFDDDVGKVASIYPENTHMEYNIPQIHLRNYRPALEGQFQGGPPGGYMQDYPPQTRKTTPSVAYPPHQYPPYNNQPQQQPPYDQSNMNHSQFLNPPGGNGQGRSPGGDHDGGRSKLFPDDDRAGTPQNQTVFGPGDKRALQFVIHAVRGHVARSHLKISCALYEEDQIVMDDFGQKCVYNTTTHNPLDLNKKDVSIMGGKMNNKAQGQDIIFKEEHVFMKDLNRLIQKNHGKKDYYLMFQILEKPEPTKIQTDSQNISYKVSETANYGGMEYDLYGWFLFKLNKAEGGVNVGKFMRKMFAPGLRQPPLDMSKIKNLESDLEFAVNEIPWPEDEDHSPDQTVNMSVATTKKNKTSKKGKKGTKSKGNKSMSKSKLNTSSVNKTLNSGPADFELINDPFIPNTKPQYIDRTFEKGMGVDFYVDGCRFLPDNVTVTKIAVQIVNVDFDIIKSAESNLPDLSVSTTYNPLFNFRIEIRPQNFNPTALAFISIDTIDKASNETKIVGYSGINLFINRFSGKQPDNQNDTDIVLLSGNYQLPIYCQEPFRTKPFNMEKIESLERLPTASILIRIRQAPLSDDGLRVLNLRDVPRKDWAAKQIWVPRPVYAAKAYNTSNYRIKDSEKELFKIRQGKEDPPLRETAQLLLNAENINKEMEDEELVAYLDSKINRNSATGLIDLLYFAKYRPEAGFKFALDGIHNVTVAQPYIGLYSLNPPGDFYVYEDGDEPNTSKLQLNSVLDWDGPLLSPKFLDGYMTFKDIVFSKNLHLIIDIRTVNLMKHPPQFSHIGWTIVPLFTPDGFVLSGIYQIPLIAGEVNKAIVQELPDNDPWGFILDQIKAKKIKWLGQASAMIRLIDAQREGHYEQSWDFTRVDYRYLPKKDLQKYAYNNNADAKAKAGKILKSIVPNKGNPQAYQKRITQAFVTELGLTQYQSEL